MHEKWGDSSHYSRLAPNGLVPYNVKINHNTYTYIDLSPDGLLRLVK